MTDAIHVPTGKRCRILQRCEHRSFCDFGGHPHPYDWVPNGELRLDDGPALSDEHHMASAMADALEVIVRTPGIRAFLEHSDPKALEQASGALSKWRNR